MGIPKLERELWTLDGCVIEVCIKELVEKYGKKVIVVDGFQFYGIYLYPKFDWVCGAFRELVQEVRNFVDAFERVGVKLVFFFAEGNLDEGSDRCGSESWLERHSDFIEYSQKFFKNLSSKNALERIKKVREYYHTPLNAQSVLLFALRHICQCDVRFVYPGDRCDAIAYFSRSSECLAILAQDNYYMFYQGVPRYISLKNLNLNKMTTFQYCPESLARHKKLEGHMYPFFLKYLSTTSEQKEMLIKISEKLNDCESVDIARKKIDEYLRGKKIEEVVDVDSNVEETLKLPVAQFLFEMLRYNFGFDYIKVTGPLTEWELIKLRAQELYESGIMSKTIQHILMKKSFYNDNILEDFSELPPSSIVYELLRKKIYGILLQEEPMGNIEEMKEGEINDEIESEINEIIESTDVQFKPGALNIWEKKLNSIVNYDEPSNIKAVIEYHMMEKGCQMKLVVPTKIDQALYPGLLSLWDICNETPANKEKKWQLFASCISDHLHWQLLCNLPPKLVVPTVVLHYLFHVVPRTFETKLWKFLQPWEVEVFIAQAVMLPKLSADSLSQIRIKNVNTRVVKLMSLFVYGCQNMRLLVEACGYPISENDLCIYNFFEGKLLHSFYERCEWRHNATNLCDDDSLSIFQQVKQIVIPETTGSSMRV